MNKWFLIVMSVVLVLSACSLNRGVPEVQETQEAYTGLTTKVAILPIKTMDARSGNIRKIMTVRDLGMAFASHPKYELLPMEVVEKQFKTLGYRDVDDLELEEMKEAAEVTDANVVIMGNITNVRPQLFAVSMRLYSDRTGELRQLNFNVVNDKVQRWKILEKDLMGELDKFISTEVDKMFNIATNFYAAGNYTEAEKQLQTAIALDPSKTEAYYYLGATYNKQKKYQLAEANFLKVLEKEENHLQSLITLNEMYEVTGETNKRLGVMEKIATINQDEELWLAIANLQVENNQAAKAEQALLNALKIQPGFALAESRLAFLLFESQRFSDAIPYLEASYDRYPENDLIARRLAVSYQRSGRMAEAIAKYEQNIRNNPNNVQAYLNLVSLYRNQASESTDTAEVAALNTKAINAMNELKKIDPDNALAYLNLASIYLSQSKNPEAETNANLAIQKDSSLYQPYIILATVSQAKGTAEYNKFVDLEKQAEKAVGSKANTLKKNRDAAKTSANGHFRKAAEQLTSARTRATEQEAITDINNRLNRVNTLISQTSGY